MVCAIKGRAQELIQPAVTKIIDIQSHAVQFAMEMNLNFGLTDL